MLAVGLVYVIDIPTLIASGLPDPSLAMHMQRDVFGTATWPGFVQGLICTFVVALMFLAILCLSLARRRRNGLHIFRGVVGVLMIFLAVMLARAAFSSSIWGQLAYQSTLLPGQALMIAVNQIAAAPAMLSAITFMLGVVILGWAPAKEKPPGSMPAPRSSVSLLVAVVGFCVAGALVLILAYAGMRVEVSTPTKIMIESSGGGGAGGSQGMRQMTSPYVGPSPVDPFDSMPSTRPAGFKISRSSAGNPPMLRGIPSPPTAPQFVPSTRPRPATQPVPEGVFND